MRRFIPYISSYEAADYARTLPIWAQVRTAMKALTGYNSRVVTLDQCEEAGGGAKVSAMQEKAEENRNAWLWGRLYGSGKYRICYGADDASDGRDTTMWGEQIVGELRKAGLEPTWDGSSSTSISVLLWEDERQ
jgi:hypothetical protein